jgi:Tfp pilus assembly protein PilO
MLGSLSRRERLLVVGAIVLAALIGGWVLLLEPIRERNRLAEEVVPAREQVLRRRLELVARKDTIAGELAATNERLQALSQRFLTEATPAVAASELQKIAKDTASQAGTEIRSERILPPVERGDLLEIPVEIAVSGEIRQLVDLLARLDASPKLLTVQDLKIRVMNIGQPKELLATLTLSGFILTGAART